MPGMTWGGCANAVKMFSKTTTTGKVYRGLSLFMLELSTTIATHCQLNLDVSRYSEVLRYCKVAPYEGCNAGGSEAEGPGGARVEAVRTLHMQLQILI